jgi:Fe-S-cluster formation regulator IscX/YfhJ
LNLQVTKKLAIKLGVELEEIDTAQYSDLENFHCNLLEFDDSNAILITNDKTLFSFVILGVEDEDFQHFEFILREEIFKILVNSELEQREYEKVLAMMKSIRYSKTSNRSTISSMNNLKFMIGSRLSKGVEFYEMNRWINRIPHIKLKFSFAIEGYKELLNR